MIDKSIVVEELEDTSGDEFDYDGDVASINAHLTGPSSAECGHFVVAREYRREGYGSVLFESLLEVLCDEGVSFLRVEIQALGEGGENDDVMEFLREYGFEYEGVFEHYNWGTCIRASGYV